MKNEKKVSTIYALDQVCDKIDSLLEQVSYLAYDAQIMKRKIQRIETVLEQLRETVGEIHDRVEDSDGDD